MFLRLVERMLVLQPVLPQPRARQPEQEAPQDETERRPGPPRQ
jgi:hypothetical protein